ncbi:DUF5916 domain-containing protein [Hyunsoonleella aestuarii]|uniref:DUF5916 domain-containing protein n=1 Tax=Hyunsoonleella aestuarii TaxID=912802 RepID=UPI0011114EAB|nr:DUF5916 domain-containing protein [Hyunsoonleella aestuarii]
MNKIFIFTFLIITSFGSAQSKKVYVKYISEAITLDGDLNELSWKQAKAATDFWNYFPYDSVLAKQQPEIKMLHDANNLYIGMKVNSPSNNYIVPSLRRDFSAGGNDNITLMFDTFNDATNAFLFGINPEGIKREMLLSGGGNRGSDFDMAWDTKWKAKTVKHEDYYISEWIIPFASFKYREGETKWRFNSYHFDTQGNETNTWINIPRNQQIFNLAFMGDMVFEKPLGKSKSPISIIPYVNSLVGKDYENDNETSDFKFGADAKLTIGNSLNLDLTINPDFSQVEVDQQVVNLTRFEVNLPERRQFFIENSDLFNDFGNSRDSNPFFSRRIGIAKDLDDNNIENEIIAGVRLSGKLNNNLRVGVLNMQTNEDIANEIASTNNALVTLQQKVFSRSNISFMFINKQATKDYDFIEEGENYNRVVGIDYRLASKDNTWNGKYYFHKSFTDGVEGNDISAGASTEYRSRDYIIRLSGLWIGDNFNSDLGFIRRTDILKIDPQIRHNFWPKNKKLQRHNISITPSFIWRPELNFENSDYTIRTAWEGSFQNTSNFELEMFNNFIRLYEEFDPTNKDEAIALPIGDYKYTNFKLQYRSDRRKVFSYSFTPTFGKFFNGELYGFSTRLNYRIQPFFNSSVQINYNHIELPNPYPKADIWLIGPRFEVTFNRSLFWTTFIQYSSQRDNFGLNARLQWRFAPLSDLFIVYNDNYFTNNVFAPRVRSINLKLNYWLSI